MNGSNSRRLVSGLVRRLLGFDRRRSGNRSVGGANTRLEYDEVAASACLPDAHTVDHAWSELRRHPALVWVPPMWRTRIDSRAAFDVMCRHAVSAIDRNLVIDVEAQGDGTLVVRLATGPLKDRPVDGGIDSVAPAGGIDSKLDVRGSSFEDAVVRLYEAVQSHYDHGPEAETATPERGTVMRLPDRLY